jgi:copper chaperone
MKTAAITIEGMTCQGCVNAVKNVLSRTPGVTASSVAVGRAEIVYVESSTDMEKLRAAITKAGFTPTT